MQRLRNFISLLLVFLIVTNSTEILRAAAISFNADANRRLVTGQINPVPIISYSGIPAEGAFLEWGDISMATNGRYELSYPIVSGKAIEFVVEKQGGIADVTYTVWDVVTNTPIVDQTGYKIYTENGEGFVGYSEYISRRLAGGDPDYIVYDQNQPKFRIKADRGFSFQYDNRTVQFRWDAESNMFMYYTDGVVRGNIYPFKLTNTADGTTQTVNVFNGISLDTLRATPTANTGKTVNDILLQHGTPTDDENPGSDDVGLEIEFAMPNVWDSSIGRFVPPSSTTALPGPLRAVIELRSTTGDVNNNIQVIIDDIRSDPMTYRLNTGAAATVVVDKPTSGDLVRLKFANLESGLIYDNSSITVNGGGLIARDVAVPLTKFFTFPRYWVQSQGEKFMIVVEAYTGFPGYYKLLASAIKPETPPDPMRVAEDSVLVESTGMEEYIYMPVSINPDNPMQLYYQVFFSPFKPFEQSSLSKEYVYSQILDYQALMGDVEIDISTFFEVVDYRMVMPQGDISGNTGALDMWFRWDLGAESTIRKLLAAAEAERRSSLDLTYEIATGLTPETSANTPLARVKVSITRNAEDPNKLMATYSSVDSLGRVLNTGLEEIQLTHDSSTGRTRYVGLTHIAFDTARKDSGLTGDLYFPNIYFATIRGIRRNDTPLSILPSPRDSFTLDYFSSLEVPPPQNLALAGDPVTTSVALGDAKDEISFPVSWDVSGASLREYMNSATNLPNDKAKFYMNLYISSDEHLMRDDFYKYSYAERINTSVAFEAGFTEYTLGDTLYFSAINGHSPLSPVAGGGYSDPRAALRDGNVVMITGLPVSDSDRDSILNLGASLSRYYVIDGVDKNQKYYVYVDFVVEHNDENGTLVIPPRASITSNLVGVTTKGDREAPTGEEKIPPAPNGLTLKSQDFGEATIQWNKIHSTSADEVLEYQIIRVTDKQMDSQYLDTAEPFANYWNNYLNGYTKAGLQTTWPSEVNVYDGSNFVKGGSEQYIYDAHTNTITLTDKTLIPNKLYFYYVRTIKTVGNSVTYSTWSHISVTTDPVKSPVNLRVEINRNDYDPRNEAIISFDAPIPDLKNLGIAYNLQYQLKPEGQDWGEHVTMPAAVLLQSVTQSSLEGYYHFEYKITGLAHSTSYMVRVRMIDEHDGSLYSNIEQFRTQFVQDDHDEKQNLNDWMYYLKQELLKLLSDPSWVTADTITALESIIRPSMWNELAAGSADSAVLLPRGDTQVISYLIPSTVLDMANGANRGFRIIAGNNEIIIAPNSFDQNQNQAMADIIGMIRQNAIVDYFLRITVNMSDAAEPINGDNALSKIINVRFEMVGSKTPVKDLDNNILKEFEAYIDEFINDSKIQEDFRARLTGSDNEALVRYVDDLVRQAKSAFLARITSRYGNMISASFAVDSLQRPFSIVTRGIDPSNSVRAYQRQANQWISIEHSPYGDDYVIYTRTPGAYVFAGGTLNIPGLADMQDAGTLTRIINKYGLDDYLGKGGFDLKQNASRLMIAGSVARIMGAPKESDPYNWLSGNKNITLSQRNMAAEITSQEAVYLAAALYEAKSGIRIDSIQIRNYNLTSSMTGLDERYLVYVRAAGELGIVDLNNFTPGAAITIKDALQMIDAVDVMLKL